MKRILIAAGCFAFVLCTAPLALGEAGVGILLVGQQLQEGRQDPTYIAGLIPGIAIPIVISRNGILQPVLTVYRSSTDDYDETLIGLGLSYEHQSSPGAASALYGGRFAVNSIDRNEGGSKFATSGSSRTDILFGGFVGGTTEFAEDLFIVGQVGLDVILAGDNGPTIIATSATLTMRWWVFGT